MNEPSLCPQAARFLELYDEDQALPGELLKEYIIPAAESVSD